MAADLETRFAIIDLIATSHFIGLANFAELTRDPAVRAAVGNTLSYLAYSVPLRLVRAVGLALLPRLLRRWAATGAWNRRGVGTSDVAGSRRFR